MDTELLQRDILDQLHHRCFGKYRGVVVENVDPEELGRLRVSVPSLLGDQPFWAMPCVPYAGEKVGFYCLPDPGANVWIEFEMGDPSLAVWTGCFWGSGDLPDKNDPDIKIWKTKKVTIRIDDANDEIKIETSNGAKITITQEIKSEKGSATHTVSSSGVVSALQKGKVDVNSAGVIVNSGSLEVV